MKRTSCEDGSVPQADVFIEEGDNAFLDGAVGLRDGDLGVDRGIDVGFGRGFDPRGFASPVLTGPD